MSGRHTWASPWYSTVSKTAPPLCCWQGCLHRSMKLFGDGYTAKEETLERLHRAPWPVPCLFLSQPVRTQSSIDTAEAHSIRHSGRLAARLGAVRECLTGFSSVDLRGRPRQTFVLHTTRDATRNKLKLKSNARYLNIGNWEPPGPACTRRTYRIGRESRGT